MMIGGVLSQQSWLWPLAWQSTAALAVGLGGSLILRHRPVRAHQALLLALTAAVLLPAMSLVVRQHQWGLLPGEPTSVRIESRPFIVATESPTTPSTASTEAANVPANTESVTRASHRPIAVKTSPAQILLALWLAASTTMLIRLIARFSLGLRLARRSEPVAAEHITEATQAAKLKLQVATPVILRSSKRARSPVIWCWGRQPILLVPDEQPDDESIDWEGIVCHELAHWRRRDHLAGLFAELMVCALPWQLLLWLVRHRLIDLSEEACDDWVIASGQVTTRYARTLLGLTPQGHAALVPAMVSSNKGLAGRVRRIITDRCANPHSNLRWTLAVTSLTACLAVGTAFAQTGASQSTDMLKTVLGHGAVVEQLASASTIEGVVLDPNNKPVDGRAFRVTALPMTSYAVEPNTQGHFHVPWSPAFAAGNNVSYLLVTGNTGAETKLAGLVEIREPTSPVTVHVQPALTIEGKVIDSSGRPVSNAAAIVSMTAEFKCRAPIGVAVTRDTGIFSIWCIPSGHVYKLWVRAKGYETVQLAVDTTDRDKRIIDIGKIVLPPDDPAKPDIAMRSPEANWAETFQRAFRLDEGEVLRLVKPPFMPPRQERVVNLGLTKGNLDSAIQSVPYLSFIHDDDGDGSLDYGGAYGGSNLPKMGRVPNWVLRIPDYDVSIPDELKRVKLPRGDWIVRREAPAEEKLRALEEIIRTELHRSIRFEKRVVERDTIVVTGRYAFTPLPGKDPNRLCIFATDNTQMNRGEAESLARLLEYIADEINFAIDDRTEPAESTEIRYVYDYSLMTPIRADPIEMQKDLPILLDNLAKQTGLKFTVEKLPAEVWFAVEDSSN